MSNKISCVTKYLETFVAYAMWEIGGVQAADLGPNCITVFPALFTKAATRKLNNFQRRCARHIIGTLPLFLFLEFPTPTWCNSPGRKPISKQLLKRQFLLLERAARAADTNPLKTANIIPGILESATNHFVRRGNWPRLEWVPRVLRRAYRILGCVQQLADQEHAPASWKHVVNRTNNCFSQFCNCLYKSLI